MGCGRISLCAEKGCNFKCCNFDAGNYIMLFPGELETALKNKKSIAHLTILEQDKYMGHKAICNASQKQNCDNGYKPIDCMFYPLFPNVIKENKVGFLKGIKCPLELDEIYSHISYVSNEIKNNIFFDQNTQEWLRNVKLVGYKTVEIEISPNGQISHSIRC